MSYWHRKYLYLLQQKQVGSGAILEFIGLNLRIIDYVFYFKLSNMFLNFGKKNNPTGLFKPLQGNLINKLK